MQLLGNVDRRARTLELNLHSNNEEPVMLGNLNNLIKPWFPHWGKMGLITVVVRRLNDRLNSWAALSLRSGN